MFIQTIINMIPYHTYLGSIDIEQSLKRKRKPLPETPTIVVVFDEVTLRTTDRVIFFNA